MLMLCEWLALLRNPREFLYHRLWLAK